MKSGQKAALVIRLFYEEERLKAEKRRTSTLIQNTDSPDLDEPIKSERTDVALAKKAGIGRPNKSMPELAEIKVSRDTSNELAKKAAIVIRLHYEEEKQRAKARQGNRTDLTSEPIGAKDRMLSGKSADPL